MKRYKMIIVSLLVGIFVFNTPIHILAATEETSSVTMIRDEQVRERLLEKAIEVFPEYEKEIRGENQINLGKTRSGSVGEIVINETRKLSEIDVVTYTQYDSGISTAAIGLCVGKQDLGGFHRGQYMLYEMNVWLTCGSSPDVLFIDSFGYGVYSNGYDEIIYKGIIRDDLYPILSPTILEYKLKEDSDGPAKISYGGYFRFNEGDGQIPYQIFGRLIIEVTNDTYHLSSAII